ncbi:MAG: terminase large subunit domain-containing protein [Bryobacteraceae bacterium]
MHRFWITEEPSGDLLYNSAWGAPSCPNEKPVVLPPPSQWAEQTFNFKPNKIQKRVLDADTKRLILCCNRQWGKSTVIAIKALHFAIEHPKSNIVVVSRTEQQGGELLAKVIDFASLAGLPDRRVRGYKHSIQLPNGARIYAIAHSTESGPSRTADVLIYDEAGLVKDNVFSVTLPFIAHTGGAVWMMSTPRGQSGFFYNFWHDKHPQWTRIFSTVDDCPEISKDFIELHRTGAPHMFRQEFYCEFTPAPGRLISVERLRTTDNPALSARKLPKLEIK